MKIIYLPEALVDMVWVRQYYSERFPEGYRNAREQIRKSERVVREQKFAGRSSQRIADARELRVQRTPFTFIYRIKTTRIEILRVVDERSDWQPDAD